MVFHDLRSPLANGLTQKAVAAELDKVEGFEPESSTFWNWLAPSRRGRRRTEGVMLDTQMDGATLLGTLELKGKALLVCVNSAERAEKIKALLTKVIGDRIKQPLTTIRTVEQMMADQRQADAEEGADEIPPEIAQQLMRDYLDRHYRETLDLPLPALGGKSPRQAARTPAGRKKVIEWLKYLENRSAGQSEGPIADYDFGWMWVELNLRDHRK